MAEILSYADYIQAIKDGKIPPCSFIDKGDDGITGESTNGWAVGVIPTGRGRDGYTAEEWEIVRKANKGGKYQGLAAIARRKK
jgi:hypothetical protein